MYDNLNDILINMNNGESYSFDFAKKNSDSTYTIDVHAVERIQAIVHGSESKLDSYCVECERVFSFTYRYVLELIDKGKIQQVSSLSLYRSPAPLGYSFVSTESSSIDEVGLSILKKTAYGKYFMNCDKNPQHRYELYLKFIISQTGKFTVFKLGQDPNSVYLRKDHTNEYRKQLEMYNSKDDYRNAVESEVHGLLAGSCTYLRRIIEKMVIYYKKQSNESYDINADQRRFIEIYDDVKENFDSDVSPQMSKIYGLLSKGIHEFSDSEISKFHHILRAVINLQLNFEKQNQEREKKKLEILHDLGSL